MHVIPLGSRDVYCLNGVPVAPNIREPQNLPCLCPDTGTDNLTRLRNLEKVSIVVDVQRLGPSEVLGGSLRDVKSIGFG